MGEETTTITRSKAITLINDSIENFFTYYDSYCCENRDAISEDEKKLHEELCDVIYILRNDADYKNDLKIMPLEHLTQFLCMCKEMVENNDLLAKTFYPKGDIVIVENQETIDTFHVGKNMEDSFNQKIKLEEITYFINNYKSVANWEYNGHGSFIAKKNATLWEIGGIYWNKLFELPPNPNLIHIGDEIHLKQDVIDKIYEVSTSDVTGEYTFDPKSPEAIDLIYGIISYCAGASDKVPKIIKYVLLDKDINDTLDALGETEETASKLSFFIQQYATEGQEEDAWKKMISVTSFFGSVFGFLGLLSNANIEENKYQIVHYNSRKAFINSAQDEIERIKQLKTQVKEEQLQTEIHYLRFLEKQVIMLKREIDLNDTRDRQQKAEILYTFSKYNTHGAVYKDDRSEKSPSYFHNIDYHKLFEEQK